MSGAPPIFVINLDRAQERWARVSGEAEALGVDLRRVSGVDGREIPPADWIDVDVGAFAARHGRTILPGEYGCHRSHLKALEALEESGASYGVILEDDVILSPEALAEIKALVAAPAAYDAVKLVNHRTKGFLPKFSTSTGLEVGLTLFGPQGSAAAYLVSRAGARSLRRRLARLSLPWDVALERYWDGEDGVVYGVVYTVGRDVFAFSDLKHKSDIGDRPAYRATKLPYWRRLPTLGFRTMELLRRARNALTRQAEAAPEASRASSSA